VEKKLSYADIQNDVIQKYRINLCFGDKCERDWRRMHAHVRERRVCKWKQANSVKATFDLFHEIGHIESNTSKMRRCEQEYHATVWAIIEMRKYGLEVPASIISSYQEYINREHDRGVRRGGNLPVLAAPQIRDVFIK
jgi:predicted DNA-binding protein (UPF0278 family)